MQPRSNPLSNEAQVGYSLNDVREAVIEICACRPWNRSLIKVELDQEYVFSTLEETEKWEDGSLRATPESGWLSPVANLFGWVAGFLKRSTKTNWYALVGAFDMSDEDTFAVFGSTHNYELDKSFGGSDSSRIKMTRSGELYFYANDMKGRYFNNKGMVKLRIVRVK